MTRPDGAAAPIYRVALLSNAMHQDNYARAFARHPRLRVVALVDEPGQEPYVVGRNRALAERCGVPYVEGLDALSDPDVDVVSLGAQIERRGRLAVEAARRGKHLWLDKPPVATATEADALVAALEAAAVKSTVVSFNAAEWLGEARRALEDGAVGDLLAAHLDFHFAKGHLAGLSERRVTAGGGARDVWTFRDPEAATDPTESSHNVVAKRELFEIGWYPVAALQRLHPRPVRRVFAVAGAYFFAAHRDLDLEDFAALTLTLADGVVVTVSAGRTGRGSHPGGSRMAVRLVGTRGTVVVDGGRPAALVYGAAPSGEGGRVLAGSDSSGLGELADAFVAHLDGAAPPIQSGRQGCEVARVLLAAYDSITTGRPVEVAPSQEGQA